jgi:hypothetical protein
MEIRLKIKDNKILINCSVETGVQGEKPLKAKLRTDYFSQSLFPYLQYPQGLF